MELQQAPPLVYLVAPALRFHPSRLTSFETRTLRDSISRLLKQGRRDIILNLSGLQFLDSSGIGELASVYVAVVEQDGQMKAIGLSSKIEDVLKTYTTLPGFPRISR